MARIIQPAPQGFALGDGNSSRKSPGDEVENNTEILFSLYLLSVCYSD